MSLQHFMDYTIKFVDERGVVLNQENALSKLRINKDWFVLAAVDNEFAALVNSKNLTRENLLAVEMTDLVRGAYYNRYLAEQIEIHLGFRPLPLVTSFYNERGENIIYRLYPHQVKALTFMRERENTDLQSVYNICGGLIKMQMGLGKTLIAITHSLISPRPVCTEEVGEKGFPTLIVVSKTVMIEWKIQGFKKFFGDRVKVLYLHVDYLGNDLDKITRKRIVKYDFVVTTYDACSSVCRKRGYHEEVLEMGDEHTLMKGKVFSINTRRRQQADRPSITGPAVIYTTPWERVICDECFTGDTRIITDQGNIRIKMLHKMKKKPRVLSFNKKDQVFEYKNITHTWEKERIQTLYQVSFGNKKYKCTPGHKWLTIDGYKETRNMSKGEVIIASEDAWNSKRNCYGYIIVTDIKKIESSKYKYTYDIEVEDNHNFVLGSMSQNNITHGPVVSNSQRFANPNTQTYRHMMAIYGRYKWCLTGTPIRNYETDIWAQLRFCGYTGIERTIEWKRTGVEKMKTHNLTKAILSMNYDDADIKLPEKHEHIVYITLSGKEKQCYEYVQKTAQDVYDKMMQGLCDYACVLAIFTRLRQCSIAPYLITAEAKREKGTVSEREKNKEALSILKAIYTGTLGAWVHDKNGTAGIYSKKITEIINTLRKIPKDEKVLLFSMFTSVLDLLANAYKKLLPDSKFVQIDGDTKGKEREKLLTEFRTNANIQSLFITYKVGAEGLNLTEATHVICIEPWWTNAVHNQAKSRCWRIGQTKEVQIYNIYVENSIEERVVEICKEKDEMAEAMLEGTGQKIKVGLDKYTLGRILGVN